LVGRDTEINKITEILCRFSKQNVLIIGDHGVGKTALIEGFVQKVLLKQIQIFSLVWKFLSWIWEHSLLVLLQRRN
jgi:GTPase SAR1 family protein